MFGSFVTLFDRLYRCDPYCPNVGVCLFTLGEAFHRGHTCEMKNQSDARTRSGTHTGRSPRGSGGESFREAKLLSRSDSKIGRSCRPLGVFRFATPMARYVLARACLLPRCTVRHWARVYDRPLIDGTELGRGCCNVFYLIFVRKRP